MHQTKQVHAKNQINKYKSYRYYKLINKNVDPPLAMNLVPCSFRQLVPSKGMPSAKGIPSGSAWLGGITNE
jgi:hypothetical protein